MASFLEDLPNELLLESLSYFKLPIRDVCQQNEPDDAWDEFYKTMASVCLASKRLAKIATPLLYSVIIFRHSGVESNHIRRLKFMRTLIQDPLLGRHITHLDDRFVLNWGQNTFKKRILEVDTHLSTSYQLMLRKRALSSWVPRLFVGWCVLLRQLPQQAIIALLLMFTPNIRVMNFSLCRDSMFGFARLVGWERDDGSSQPQSYHGFRQLHTLRIKNMYGLGLCNTRFQECLRGLEALKYYYFSDATPPWTEPNSTPFLANLRTLHFSHETLTLHSVAKIVRNCSQLRAFSFLSWHGEGHISFSTLYQALWVSKETLEHIELSTGQNFDQISSYSPIGSFKDFHNLKILRIPEFFLMGRPPNIGTLLLRLWTDYRPGYRIVECLPKSLELFIFASETTCLSEDTAILWDFLQDVPLVPNLRTVGFNGRWAGDTSKLTTAFEAARITSRETMPGHDRLRLLDGGAVRDRSCHGMFSFES